MLYALVIINIFWLNTHTQTPCVGFGNLWTDFWLGQYCVFWCHGSLHHHAIRAIIMRYDVYIFRSIFQSCWVFFLSFIYCISSMNNCWLVSIHHGQYHGCWCPGSAHHQVNSMHDISCVMLSFGGSGEVSTFFVIQVFRNYLKCKYILCNL